MKVLLFEYEDEHRIVLWDGENTYWSDEMKPSPGYVDLILDEIENESGLRFSLIGEL